MHGESISSACDQPYPRASFARMVPSRSPALEVGIRLLNDPCLWCWEIVDRQRRNALVHSSWTGEWSAYTTREEALGAGRARLAELQSSETDGSRGGHGWKGASAV